MGRGGGDEVIEEGGGVERDGEGGVVKRGIFFQNVFLNNQNDEIIVKLVFIFFCEFFCDSRKETHKIMHRPFYMKWGKEMKEMGRGEGEK